MAENADLYDLMLVLDPQLEDGERTRIVADARRAIEGGGELVRYAEWGERPLAYPIDRKANGEYHLFQFHPGSAELLHGLDRTLHITDGILRFRIIKLRPGVPDPPDMGGAHRPEAQPAGEPAPAAAAAESA